MWDALNAGTVEMWAAAWQATVDPDMYQVYHSASVKSNYYHINDETLDQDIIDARSTADQENLFTNSVWILFLTGQLRFRSIRDRTALFTVLSVSMQIPLQKMLPHSIRGIKISLISK